MGGSAGGNLQSVKKDRGATGADVAIGKGLENIAGGVGDSVRIEGLRNLDATFSRGALAGRRNAAAVVIAEGAASHGGGLAAESAGHDVTTGFVHGLPFCAPAPIPSHHPGWFRQAHPSKAVTAAELR